MTQATALALTLVMETGAAALWWTTTRVERPPLVRLLLTAVCVSLLTHPLAWWANHALVGELARWTRVGVIETSVVVAEALLYLALVPLSRARALTLSILANATSFGLGLVILALLRG